MKEATDKELIKVLSDRLEAVEREITRMSKSATVEFVPEDLGGISEIRTDAGSIKTKTLWVHYNGAAYRVVAFTNVAGAKEKYPPTVVYQNIGNSKVYSRPASDWHRSMTEIVTAGSVTGAGAEDDGFSTYTA